MCKGECGKESVFGKWCCENYHDCEGYRKKLSNKAKARGNNGVRGKLSKKYFLSEEICKDIVTVDLQCSKCSNIFSKSLKVETLLRSKFKPLCQICINEKIVLGMRKKFLNDRKNIPYEKLSLNEKKLICWKKQGEKCNRCGYNQYPIETGPYELHHKDGNRNNYIRENEEVICANCHTMTDNYRFKNRKHTEEAKNRISQNNFMKKSKGKVMVEIAQR